MKLSLTGNWTSAVRSYLDGRVSVFSGMRVVRAGRAPMTTITCVASMDGAGNVTAVPLYTFTYNGAEQMTQAVQNGSTTTNYTYVGADQKSLLSLSTPGGSSRTFQYGRADQNGNPTLTSATTDGKRANVVNDAKTGQPIGLSTPSNVLAQYTYDASGNPWGLLVDSPAAGDYSFDPYGTSTVTYNGGGDGPPSNPFGFKAGINDTHTGLVKFGLRWYNPYLGSWTQQDTLDSPLDPSNGNRYAYAASDPINGSDPAGLLTKTQKCGLAFVGLGVIAGVLVASAFTGGAALAATAAAANAIADASSTAGILVGAGVAARPRSYGLCSKKPEKELQDRPLVL